MVEVMCRIVLCGCSSCGLGLLLMLMCFGLWKISVFMWFIFIVKRSIVCVRIVSFVLLGCVCVCFVFDVVVCFVGDV